MRVRGVGVCVCEGGKGACGVCVQVGGWEFNLIHEFVIVTKTNTSIYFRVVLLSRQSYLTRTMMVEGCIFNISTVL